MIDEKMLANDEEFMRAMAEKHPGGTECFLRQAEIIRNARRYLVDREREVSAIIAAIERGECEYISAEDIRKQFDAAADRLLEGGE